jgi:hypothetical protein
VRMGVVGLVGVVFHTPARAFLHSYIDISVFSCVVCIKNYTNYTNYTLNDFVKSLILWNEYTKGCFYP